MDGFKSESETSDPSVIGPILDLLESAGYGDAKSDDLSDSDKIFRGLVWCISSVESSDHSRKIDTVEDIEVALKLMGCPHALQASLIEDLCYPRVYPAVQWIVSRVKAQHVDNSDQNEQKVSVWTEVRLLKEKIEEAGIGSLVQQLNTLMKKSEALKSQGNEFQSDCSLHNLRLQGEIAELEDLTLGNDDKDPHDYLDCSISDLSKKVKYVKKELSSKLRESVSLKRQLDELPIEAELVQYERRFSELNILMQDRLRQTRKYYETYNALLEIKDLMLKETSLLNSVESQFGNAIGNPAGRTQLIDSLEAILRGIQQKLEKVQLGLQMEQKNLDSLRQQYSAAIINQRHCSILLKDFQEECKKNEKLKREFKMQENQRGQTSS